MTNWNLLWEKNFEKHKDSLLWNWNFNIKYGDYIRFYHWFTMEELEKLFKGAWFSIIENRIFEWENNILSIVCL
jgi:hypothetical protein